MMPSRAACCVWDIRSANTNLLSVPYVCSTFNTPAVWNSLPSGIRDSSSTHTFRRLLKTHCFQQAFGSPSSSPKFLRFGHRLTMYTLKIHLLSYLLTVDSRVCHEVSLTKDSISWRRVDVRHREHIEVEQTIEYSEHSTCLIMRGQLGDEVMRPERV